MSSSPLTVNLVICVLGMSVLGFGGAAWHLAAHNHDYKDFLLLASAAAGAIGSMLAKTDTHPKDATKESLTHTVSEEAKK